MLTDHSTFLPFRQEALCPSCSRAQTHVPEMLSSSLFSCLSFKLRSKIIFSKMPPRAQTSLGPSFIGSYSIYSACQHPSSMSAVSCLRAHSDSAAQWLRLMLWTLSTGSSQVLGFLFLCKLLLGNITMVDINETHGGPMGTYSLHLAVKTNSLNEGSHGRPWSADLLALCSEILPIMPPGSTSGPGIPGDSHNFCSPHRH